MTILVVKNSYSKCIFFTFPVDNEFESVATQLLKRTQAMLNKYRCLLLEDAMVRLIKKNTCAFVYIMDLCILSHMA